MYADIVVKARQRIEEHLHAGLREGVFSFKSSPVELSITLHDLLLGSFVNTLTTAPTAQKIMELKKYWNYVFDSLLVGPTSSTGK